MHESLASEILLVVVHALMIPSQKINEIFLEGLQHTSGDMQTGARAYTYRHTHMLTYTHTEHVCTLREGERKGGYMYPHSSSLLGGREKE